MTTGRPPVLFKTMVFGGELDEKVERYCTWEEAEKGHLEILDLARRTTTSELKKEIMNIRKRALRF